MVHAISVVSRCFLKNPPTDVLQLDFVCSQYRRRLGCRVAYCVTWHRLARVFMVGLPRREVEALRARDRAAAAVAAPPRQLAPGVPPRIGDVMQGAVMRADGAPRPGA